jgi:hypothetical protein
MAHQSNHLFPTSADPQLTSQIPSVLSSLPQLFGDSLGRESEDMVHTLSLLQQLLQLGCASAETIAAANRLVTVRIEAMALKEEYNAGVRQQWIQLMVRCVCPRVVTFIY